VFNFNSQSGKIAQELDYVNHHVRTKLDEIKRREVERLRELANQAYELSNDIDRKHLKVSQHLDHDNEHTFEIEDLRKLIQKTSDDLAEADRKRRGEFKEYEMQKEFEREAQKKEMDEESRKKFETELKEKEEKHKDHEKLHHPGNKAQLEDVWEKQDHMDKNDFDPKTFFSIHDVDSNGYWDEAEVKALFVKELDKVYQSDLPEDDMRERAEEMERMREHYFQETDMNHDGLISIDEFMVQTNKEEFQKDPEWETIDRQQQYTHEEYLEYERRRQEEVQRLIAQGQLPPHPRCASLWRASVRCTTSAKSTRTMDWRILGIGPLVGAGWRRVSGAVRRTRRDCSEGLSSLTNWWPSSRANKVTFRLK